MQDKGKRLQSYQALNAIMNEYWSDVKKAPSQGRPVVWSSAIGPIDLLTAMDLAIVFPENYAAVCGAKKVATEFCQIAESMGYSPDLCSYARNGLGAALSGNKELCPVGGLPKPDLLIASSYCTAIIKWFEDVSRFFDVPLVLLDYPYGHDTSTPEDREQNKAYIKNQLEEIIEFLERHFKRRFDYGELRKKLAITDQLSRIWEQIMRTLQNIPAPITVFDLFQQMFPITCMRGDPKAVDYYKQLKMELDARVRNGIGTSPNERFRLYFDNIAVWYKLRELSTEFASHDAALVAGLYPWAFVFHSDASDPNEPLDYIAEIMTDNKLMLGVQRRVDFISQLVKEYSIDGLIMQSSRTCKIMCLGQPDVMELVEERTGVPAVTLEADMCDSRYYSEAQINMRIRAFMELLDNRRQGKSA